MFMKSCASFIFLIVVMISGSGLATAAPVAVGDYITFENGPGTTGGGEFIIHGDGIDAFITFCLQRTQYVDFSHEFLVDDISTYAYSDPIANVGARTGRHYLTPH